MLHEHQSRNTTNSVQNECASSEDLSSLHAPLCYLSIDNPLKDQTCRDIGHRLLEMSLEVREAYEQSMQEYEEQYEQAGTLKKLYLRLRKPKDPDGAVDKDHFFSTLPDIDTYEFSAQLLLLYRTGLINVVIEEVASSDSHNGRVIRGFRPTEELARQIYKYPLTEELEITRGSWYAELQRRR